jgi:hypothetical protein
MPTMNFRSVSLRFILAIAIIFSGTSMNLSLLVTAQTVAPKSR